MSGNKILLCLDRLSQHETWCGYRLAKQSLEEQSLSSFKTSKTGTGSSTSKALCSLPIGRLAVCEGPDFTSLFSKSVQLVGHSSCSQLGRPFLFWHRLAKSKLDSTSRQWLRLLSLLDWPRFLRGLFFNGLFQQPLIAIKSLTSCHKWTNSSHKVLQGGERETAP